MDVHRALRVDSVCADREWSMTKTNEQRQRAKTDAHLRLSKLLHGLTPAGQKLAHTALNLLLRLVAGDSYRQGYIAGKKVKK